MLKINSPKLAIGVLSVATIALASGCANMQNKQAAAAPITPDANAIELVKQVKQQPSTISGGGMIYELFVGNHFSARVDDKSKELKITDFAQNGSCEYDSKGLLKIPAGAKDDFAKTCSQISSSALDFLKK